MAVGLSVPFVSATTIHAGAGLFAWGLSMALAGVVATGVNPRSLRVARWLSALIPTLLGVTWVFGTLAYIGEYQDVAPLLAAGPQPQASVGVLAGFVKKRIFFAVFVISILVAVLFNRLTVADFSGDTPGADDLRVGLTLASLVVSGGILLIESLGVILGLALRSALLP